MTKTNFNKVSSVVVCFIMLVVIMIPQGNMTVNAVTSADLSISDNGISFICAREGFHATCYSDYSQSSIGYGTKCTGSSVQPHASGSHTITKEAAMAALKTQINSTYAPRVRAQTSGITMNQNQFDALVSLCYNCGGGSTLIANSPLVRFLKGELSESQARSQYSNYIVTAGGQRLQGLVNRRNAEADLFFTSSFTLSAPSVHTRHKYFAPNSDIDVLWNKVDGATGYIIDIWRDGSHIISRDLGDVDVFTDNFTGESYTIYITAYNGNSSAQSDGWSFYLKPMYPPEVYTRHKYFAPNADIDILWNKVEGANGYVIDIWRNGSHIISKDLGDVTSFTDTFTGESYEVYITAYNNIGGYTSATSEACTFYLKEMTAPSVRTRHKYFAPNSDIDILWNKVEGAEGYVIDIWRDGKHIINKDLGNKTVFTDTFTGESYKVYVTAYNNIGGSTSATSEACVFYLKEMTTPIISAKFEKNIQNSNITLSWNEIEGAVGYIIDIWRDGKHIIGKDVGTDTSFSDVFMGKEYSIYVTAYNDVGGYTFAQSEAFEFTLNELGDVNADGKFNVSDVVLLQKWLLAVPDTHLANWQTADLCEDGRLDVFDLCLMKRMLVENS